MTQTKLKVEQLPTVTTVADPGLDTTIPTEKAVRDALGALTAGGQYRQFTYVVTAGDFSFIIDATGNPVMALQDLE